MKEFGKRLLIVLMYPLWFPVHLIYLFIHIFILGPIFIFIIIPLVYLFSGRDASDWWLDIFEITMQQQIRFQDKIKEL